MKYNGPFVRQPGMYDVKQACEECCIADFGPSLTQQSQTQDADINQIVKRFGLTGQLPDNLKTPTYDDWTDVMDYEGALNRVRDAQDNFMKMPAGIRSRFDNDPQKFLEYATDPKNMDGLREMGLAKAKEPKQEVQGGPNETGPGLGGGGGADKPQKATGVIPVT